MKALDIFYREELSKVFKPDKAPKYARTIKVTGDEVNTTPIALNDRSAQVLIDFLKEHYNVK